MGYGSEEKMISLSSPLPFSLKSFYTRFTLDDYMYASDLGSILAARDVYDLTRCSQPPHLFSMFDLFSSAVPYPPLPA